MRRGLLTLFGLVGLLAAAAAASTVWLVLQEPVVVADAVSSGKYWPLFSTLTHEIGQLCRALVTLL
jgi:hypothetical protein